MAINSNPDTPHPVFIVDHVGTSYGGGANDPTVVVGHSAQTAALKRGTRLYAAPPATLSLLDDIKELREALEGVIRVADRATDEFDRARAALLRTKESS